ncbi:zinc-binding dehydrogenase [Streptomyces sp. 3MP-14]|uniref:Zinc-binding dehydrogenase n=1 Tax=Streptomyces mimosae TaxID=2586635 RepID=A0A5N6AP40_9ACTN|nr:MULTISPECIES: NADP-dependent oxidoreductase [Streptomyces]KAB8169660.1 zinc-binding dehydrogenase [Streptomyces mimosae]KAB8178408.1 zinc-binding dehydrogenase [Streptomyces sp. 3MP-14]
MRAVVADEYGGSEVLGLRDVPLPATGPDDVLVRVVAAGTNPADWECRSGLAADWFGAGPYVWGWDVSGVVEAVGERVTAFAPGDEVYGMPRFPELAQGYAEFVSAPAAELAPKPVNLPHQLSAALPLSGLTAAQTLERAGASAGQRVLVHGAAGGVGHLVVQLARARGCHVIAVARPTAHAVLRELGAHEVVERADLPRAEDGPGVDVAVDCVGDDALLAAVRPGGVFARVPGAAAGPGSLAEPAAARGVRLVHHVVHPDGPGLARLTELVEAGALAPRVSLVLPLEQAALAHEVMERGHGLSKLVLSVAPEPASGPR